MPTFQLGFKCEAVGKGESAIRKDVIGYLAAEALLGESSQLYLKLYEEGIIDSSFGGSFETLDGCAMLTCGGDGQYPEKVREAMIREAEQLVREGIPEVDFLRLKRGAMGRRIRDLDSFDSTCFRLCAYHFTGFDYFDFPAVYADVTAEEVRAFLATAVKESRCAVSIVEPVQS